MKTILFLSILIFNLSYAQKNTNGTIVYKKEAGPISPRVEKYKLYFNNKYSFFDELYTKEEHEKRNKGVSRDIQEIFDVGPDFQKIYYFYDLTENKFFFKSFLLLQYAVAKDDLRFDWEIKNETKTIVGFTCQRAVSKKFRGRIYEAWFSAKIPVPFGPWKVNGLPGIILEFYDTDKLIHFKAISVVLNSNMQVDFSEINKKVVNESPLSIKEYISLKKKLNQQFFSLIESRLPRNMRRISSHRTRLEIYTEDQIKNDD